MRTFVASLLALLLSILSAQAAAFTLSGTIYGGSSPLEGASITLTDATTAQQRGSVATAGDGVYSFDVTDGGYRLEIEAPSGSGFGTTFVNDIAIDGGDVIRNVALVGQANTLSGTITLASGRAVNGARVSAYRQDDPYPSGTKMDQSFTDDTGRYSMVLTPDTYMLRIEADGGSVGADAGAYRESRAAQNVDLSSDAVIDFELPYITVSGRTVDANGVAVPGVVVEVERASGSSASYGPVTVHSDAQGQYSLMTPPYTYDLLITPPLNSGFATSPVDGVDLGDDTTQDVVLVFADETAPRILTGPVVTSIEDTTAVVSWQTDEPATTLVTVDGVEFGEPGLRTEHSVQLTALQPTTPYTAVVASSDAAGNGPVTATTAVFETTALPDTVAPVILSGPVVSGIGFDSAIVRWTSDEPTLGTLRYGAPDPTEERSLPGARREHEIVLTGLAPSTRYTLRAEVTDQAGNGPTTSEPVLFETLAAPDRAPPVIVAGPLVTDVTDTEVTIVWRTDEPSVSGVSANDGERYTV